jgi:hypothetical protein
MYNLKESLLDKHKHYHNYIEHMVDATKWAEKLQPVGNYTLNQIYNTGIVDEMT